MAYRFDQPYRRVPSQPVQSSPPPRPSPSPTELPPHLQLFTCPKSGDSALRITPRGCAEMWNKARTMDKEDLKGDLRYHCFGCPIGARHAGQTLETAEADQAKKAPNRCTRCRKITGRRYIHRRLCISCFNRGLEAVKGKNRKGLPPIKLPRLVNAKLAFVDLSQQPARLVFISVGVANFYEGLVAASHFFTPGKWLLIPSLCDALPDPPKTQAARREITDAEVLASPES